MPTVQQQQKLLQLRNNITHPMDPAILLVSQKAPRKYA